MMPLSRSGETGDLYCRTMGDLPVQAPQKLFPRMISAIICRSG